ncbi:tetratricopeptide repeat-containing diguanylate cyclase [Ideonella sp. BN130291]|uniref:tetratricopeptide repeat-containing diguanylate cyclase n=1 Tax=Ideonella sp. BN130291 TaxID=3112940 RepID=UPI002E272AA8|nr:tetratricopeptide repeat-containing diguanylate cyclase [Ideonella sp. BN130291]
MDRDAVPPSPATPPPDAVAALLAASRGALASADHRSGLAQAQQAREALTAESGLRLAQALSLEGQHLWRLGRFEDAVVAAREALHLWQEVGDPAGHADALCLLAVSYTELGLHEEGLKSATAAFELARAHGLQRETTLALNRIGVCHERLGDPDQGERFLLQALSRAREQRSFDDTVQALNNLMANTLGAYHLHSRRGDPEVAHQALQRARQYGGQAVAMARRDGDVYRRIVTQGNLAEVLAIAGDFEQAGALLDDAVAEARSHGYRAVEMRSRHNLGEMRLLQGRHEEAVQLLHTVLDDLRRGTDHETTRMRVHSALYRAYKALGRFEPALAHCEAYYAIEMQRSALQAQAQARLMVNRLDMEHALQMADRALMDAARERIKASELEAQKRALEAHSQALHRDAHEDALTGLHNRRRADQALPQLIAQARAQGQPLQVAVMDVDWFKGVNDQYGHAVGDEVLRTVAQILQERLRTRDLAARLGGEEFLVVLVDSLPAAALEVCERLRAAVQQHPWDELAPGLQVTVSIGLADVGEADDATQAMQRADDALYRAKNEGRNRVCAAA